MPYKLSICIPTYNRAEYLKECLKSILLSANGYEQHVEIIVSDNASTDNTRNIVNSFKTNCASIRYHRNDVNIGAARNFYTVASIALGKYIWLFGDDDKMEEFAIHNVLRNIDSDYGLIIYNYSIWDNNFSVMKKKSAIFGSKDRVFQDPNEVMKYLGLHLGYISTIVFKKSIFFLLPYDEYERFVDYGFPVMYALYSGLAIDNCRAAYISAPAIQNRSGSPFEYDYYKIYVVGTALVYELLKDRGYTESAVRCAKHRVILDVLIPNLFYRKMQNKRNRQGLIRMMLPYYKGNWIFWIVYLPALFTPPLLVRFARNIVHTMRRLRFCFSIVK